MSRKIFNLILKGNFLSDNHQIRNREKKLHQLKNIKAYILSMFIIFFIKIRIPFGYDFENTLFGCVLDYSLSHIQGVPSQYGLPSTSNYTIHTESGYICFTDLWIEGAEIWWYEKYFFWKFFNVFNSVFQNNRYR